MEANETIYDVTKSFYFKGSSVGILLVHGFTGTPQDLRSAGEYLAQKGYSVYGVRLHGHGIHHQVLKRTNRFDWFFSLKRAVENFRNDAGLTKLYLLGFSMGGNLCLLFSQLEGGVDGLILVNTPIYTKPGRLIFWFIPLIKRFKKYTTKKWVKNMDHYFERRDTGSYYRVPLESAWQFYKIVQDSKEVIEDIKIPVLIYQSSKDTAIHPRSADFIYRKLRTSDKKIKYFETGEHHLLNSFPRKLEIFEGINRFISEKAEVQI